MTYQIRKSDGTLLVDLADGTTDNTRSPLTLIGKNVSSFGKDQNENFVHILENFANTSQPTNSLTGQLWFNKTNSQLYVKTSLGFQSIGPFNATTTTNVTSNSSAVATTAFVHSVLPKGSIIMWSGVTIPTGWALCNGQTISGLTTPNLTDKFIMGAGSTYIVNQTGGRSTINQTVAHSHYFSLTTGLNSVDHTHSGATSNSGIHRHVFPGDDQLDGARNRNGWLASSLGGFPYDARSERGGGGQMWETSGNGDHSHTFVTGLQSSSHTHDISGNTSAVGNATVDIINPYYALAYIIKVTG